MAEFFAMGGYAPFVWGSFGAWLLCMVYNLVSARRRHRAALDRASIAAARQKIRSKEQAT